VVDVETLTYCSNWVIIGMKVDILSLTATLKWFVFHDCKVK